MRAVELFAGVGGFRLGLARNGIRTVYANEWDRYASDTYDYNFQGERIDRRDITTVPESDIPAHDVLVGGFPCQAFSVAGKRRGFDETRGTLFFDVARILAHHRPGHLVLENVKGLLNHDGGKTVQVILGVLTGLGYRVEWCVLNSADFGVPQNRERIYIVGHLGGKCGGQVFPLGGEDGEPAGEGSGLRYLGGLGSPNRLDDGRQHSRNYKQGYRVYGDDGLANCLPSQGVGGPGGATGLYAVGTVDHGRFRETEDRALNLDANYWKGHDNHGARTVVKQQGVTLDIRSEGGIREIDRAGTINSSYSTGIMGGHGQRPAVMVREATKQGYAIAEPGDSINISVPTSATPRGRVQKQSAGTLQTSESMATLLPDARIRRLTPRECERLQAFPDDWTMYGLRPDGTEYVQSDTQRYKQMGNAVTTNVVAAVAAQLVGQGCLS